MKNFVMTFNRRSAFAQPPFAFTVRTAVFTEPPPHMSGREWSIIFFIRDPDMLKKKERALIHFENHFIFHNVVAYFLTMCWNRKLGMMVTVTTSPPSSMILLTSSSLIPTTF